jgi:1-acyl-sn-glycerol-3-phosphate acyltransferase
MTRVPGSGEVGRRGQLSVRVLRVVPVVRPAGLGFNRRVRLDELASRVRVGTPGRPSAAFLRRFPQIAGPLLRILFRPRFVGAENLPRNGPYLLVGNHSAGLAIAEIACFILSWLERFGAERPLAGMAHAAAFHVWPAAPLLRGCGAIPSSYAHSEAALGEGVPILIFPGGDHETLRPIWQANRVDFGGRKGFLKIAQKMGVPIVPLGIHGSHYTAPMLWRSRWLATLAVLPRAIGARRWGLSLLGVLLASGIALSDLGWALKTPLIWASLATPIAMLPWVPWTITFRIGAPIPPEALFDRGLDDTAMLERAYARVIGEIQSLVVGRAVPGRQA